MKNYFFCLCFCLSFYAASIAQDSLQNKVYTIVEEMPYLKRCDQADTPYKKKRYCSDVALLNYMMEHITLDTFDLFYSDCCNAYVSFVINTAGQTEDITIIRGINKSFDARLIELLANLPPWIPGKQRGKTVKVKLSFPIRIHPRFD